jgi:hypothetical protein
VADQLDEELQHLSLVQDALPGLGQPSFSPHRHPEQETLKHLGHARADAEQSLTSNDQKTDMSNNIN